MMNKATHFVLFLLLLAATGCSAREVPAAQAPPSTRPSAVEESAGETASAEQPQEGQNSPTAVPATATTMASPAPTETPEPPPTEAPTETPPAALDLDSSDVAPAIYAAAIRHVYDRNFAFGDEAEFPLVYLIAETGDGQTLQAPMTAPQKVPDHLQQSIVEALSGEPYEIIWTPRVADVPVGSSGQIAGGEGIYMILGNILPQEDGSLHLPLIMVCGTLCLSGTTYVLEEAGGTWQVTGTTGLEVMG